MNGLELSRSPEREGFDLVQGGLVDVTEEIAAPADEARGGVFRGVREIRDLEAMQLCSSRSTMKGFTRRSQALPRPLQLCSNPTLWQETPLTRPNAATPATPAKYSQPRCRQGRYAENGTMFHEAPGET